LIRVNLLHALGAELGYVGEYIFSKALRGAAARGGAVAILLEGLYSAGRVEPRGLSLPREKEVGVFSRHVLSKWPIHKSWFVPVVDDGEPAVLIDPPKGLVKYVGRDVEGSYAYLLSLGLDELKSYVFKGVSPSVLKGVEEFTEVELNVAAVLYERLRGGPDFAALVVDTIREVDFLLAEGAVIYHVEVKTTMNPTDVKLRKKRMLLQKRQNVLEKLGLRPALAVVVPKENWEVEVWIEKTTS
jgi:hypothetical protein